MAVNYWAILAAGVAAWVIGALWYSPVALGPKWGAAHGYTAERMAGMRARMLPAFIISFVGYLVIAYIVARVLGWSGRSGAGGGLEIALMLWVGFFLLEGLSSHLYSDRKAMVFYIDGGFRLAYMIAIGLIVGLWR